MKQVGLVTVLMSQMKHHYWTPNARGSVNETCANAREQDDLAQRREHASGSEVITGAAHVALFHRARTAD
jgi:hypothetical protein